MTACIPYVARLIVTRWNIGQSQGVYQNCLPWERGIGHYVTLQVSDWRVEIILGAR